MKELEKELDYSINPKLGFIIRLDGKGFSKFTKKYFIKPYDYKLDEIFQEVTKKLISEFNVKLGYTQSDEITLYFELNDSSNSYFNLRIQKLVSLIASKTTAFFILESLKKWFEKAIEESIPVFDARIFEINTLEDLHKSFEFRYFDCLRNSRLNLSVFLPKKDRLNKSWLDIVKEVKELKQFDYFSLPLSYRKGTYFLKTKELKEFCYKEEKGLIERTIVKKINIENFPNLEEFNSLFL